MAAPLGDLVRRSRLAALVALAVAASLAPAARADAPAYDPCPSQPSYAWMGASVAQPVLFASLTQPSGQRVYRGTILRPGDLRRYGGRRPAVVLQHGLNGNQCALWWAARDLAGHGYVTLVYTTPDSAAFDAMPSAVAFLRSRFNPLGSLTDGARIGLSGHSLGSIVTSDVQGSPDPGVRAAVAFDNLHHWLLGDPGAAQISCVGAPSAPVAPRVPALGFAKDAPCSSNPSLAPPDLKLSGWSWWRAHGVPSMDLVMRGFDHGDFAGAGSEAQHRELAHYVEAWFDRWLRGRRSADARLLARRVLGAPAADLLSERFRSGAYLPPRTSTSDFAACLRSPSHANCRAGS
jgi:hypothetical protein